MTNYFVETYLFDANGNPVQGSYFDGRERKHLHTNAASAARDFGERVLMCASATEPGSAQVSSELEFTAHGTDFKATFSSGNTIVISLY